jgi:hypothetical protein
VEGGGGVKVARVKEVMVKVLMVKVVKLKVVRVKAVTMVWVKLLKVKPVKMKLVAMVVLESGRGERIIAAHRGVTAINLEDTSQLWLVTSDSVFACLYCGWLDWHRDGNCS